MNKKLIIVFLTISTIFLLSGCGKKPVDFGESVIDITSNIDETTIIPLTTTDDLPHSDHLTNPDCEGKLGTGTIKASELYFASAEFLEDYCSKYYSHIGESIGVEWDKIDWIGLRPLLYKLVFGYGTPEWADELNPAKISIIPDLTDPAILYEAPPEGYVDSLTDDELLQYYKDSIIYFFPDIDLDVDSLEIFTPDQLQVIREDLKMYEKHYKDYVYERVD